MSRLESFLQCDPVADRSPAFRWAFSLGLFVAALAIRMLLDHQLPPGFPFLTFFPAVILATLVSGLWPGLVNAALGGLAAWYFFVAPYYSLALSPAASVAMLFYAFIVVVDIMIIHGLNRAMIRVRHALIEVEKGEQQRAIITEEMAHRLKNSFAMVHALAGQTLRNAIDRETYEAFERRLMTLSSAHEVLLQYAQDRLPIGNVVERTMDSLGVIDRVKATGPEIMLGSSGVVGLSLLLHELATNAIKYGALSDQGGVVEISWSLTGDGEAAEMHFSWRERGGPPPQMPGRTGFGSRLIKRGLTGSGGVALRYELPGFSAEMSAPLVDVVK